jgi:hypothetical protein
VFVVHACLLCMLSCDMQAQIPRSVYNGTGHGVVIVRCRQRRLFLLTHESDAVVVQMLQDK